MGTAPATIDWLLTDSRSLSFPEETLFFALPAKRNTGANYIPELIARGVRNFVVSEEDFSKEELGMKHEGQGSAEGNVSLNYLVVPSPLKALQRLAEQHRGNIGISSAVGEDDFSGRFGTKDSFTSRCGCIRGSLGKAFLSAA